MSRSLIEVPPDQLGKSFVLGVVIPSYAVSVLQGRAECSGVAMSALLRELLEDWPNGDRPQYPAALYALLPGMARESVQCRVSGRVRVDLYGVARSRGVRLSVLCRAIVAGWAIANGAIATVPKYEIWVNAKTDDFGLFSPNHCRRIATAYSCDRPLNTINRSEGFIVEAYACPLEIISNGAPTSHFG